MIRALIKLGAGAALVFAPVLPAAAQEVEFDQIEKKNLDSGKESLDPAKAYIYVTGPNRTNGVFLKAPDDADIAEYETEWKEEFAKAVKKHPGRVKRYERQLATWQKTRRGGKPEMPVEPTEETFAIGDIQRRMIVTFGPQFVYDKSKADNGDKTFSYLIEVEPGTYSYYGPIFYAPGVAPAGICYCMGSVKFDAPAGKVTSLGDFLAFQWVTGEVAVQSNVSADPEFFPVSPDPVDFSGPAELESFGVQPADLRAAGKMNNLFGIMIGRMPPYEGVLDYDRDIPIDVKGLIAEEAAQAAASAPAPEAASEETVGSETAVAIEDADADTDGPETPVEDVSADNVGSEDAG